MKIRGDEVLRGIAQELVVRARLRVLVKRITVLKHAEALSEERLA